MWIISNVKCHKCSKCWVMVREKKVVLTHMPCPLCGEIGYVIATDEKPIEKLCYLCKKYKDNKCKLEITHSEECQYFEFKEQ